MALGLDLSSSEAKVARAKEHLEALERGVPNDLAADAPYALRFSPVDPSTGWCEVFLVPRQTGKPRLSAVMGDIIHNLRCALDYIVTVLVDASQTKLTTRHQFPIHADESGYIKSVATPASAVKNGPLTGVVHGLGLIEQVQPYKRSPDPRRDPLWHVHRFSNADKHREPATPLVVPGGAIQISFNGIPVEEAPVAEIPNWSPNDEHLITRIRFDPPHAYNLRASGPLKVKPYFTTPAFGTEPEHTMSLQEIRGACEYVTMVVESFKLL